MLSSCLQRMLIVTYIEPTHSSDALATLSCSLYFIIALRCTPSFFFSSLTPIKILWKFLVPLLTATQPANIKYFDPVTMTTLGEQYRLRSSSLCSFLRLYFSSPCNYLSHHSVFEDVGSGNM
jgi:hypothetical protein